MSALTPSASGTTSTASGLLELTNKSASEALALPPSNTSATAVAATTANLFIFGLPLSSDEKWTSHDGDRLRRNTSLRRLVLRGRSVRLPKRDRKCNAAAHVADTTCKREK